MLRRWFDFSVAVFGLAVLSPLLTVVGALVRLDDGGPALFTQTRLGRGRRPFRIYKFRTMRDGNITRHGRWLRATGIDELPQLLNLVRGEMSLIGPRPLTAEDVLRLGWDAQSHDVRWEAQPGIAGLAQIFAGRGARLSWFLDVRYVRGRTLAMDVEIVALAATMLCCGKRRVRRWLRTLRQRSHAQPSAVSASTSLPNRRPASMSRCAAATSSSA
jgi:lipopolysaccharide/colanic/teichoic acid biosynthesis glycosyltransferase